MTGSRYFAKQRERARLAAIRESTANAVNAAVGKRWLDEGADAPACAECGGALVVVGQPWACPVCGTQWDAQGRRR